MVLVRDLLAGHTCPPFHEGMICTTCILLFLTKNQDTKERERPLERFNPQRSRTLGTPLHILTFGTRARPKEHRVNMESENPKRDTAVIDIIGREGYHLPHTSTIIVARSGLEKGRM